MLIATIIVTGFFAIFHHPISAYRDNLIVIYLYFIINIAITHLIVLLSIGEYCVLIDIH